MKLLNYPGKRLANLRTWSTIAWMLFSSVAAHAVSLAWEANSEPDVIGYRLYYGVASRGYSQVIDVQAATSHSLDGLETGRTYYASVTAYNSTDLESTFSNEVSFTVAAQYSDADADGLPDGWETANGFDPADSGSGSTVNGAQGDPDADGIPNFLEYAFALDPRQSSQLGLPSPTIMRNSANGLRYLTLTFRTRSDIQRLLFTVEASPTLAQWSPASYEEISRAELPGGAGFEVTVRLLPAMEELAAPCRFARVLVQTIPAGGP